VFLHCDYFFTSEAIYIYIYIYIIYICYYIIVQVWLLQFYYSIYSLKGYKIINCSHEHQIALFIINHLFDHGAFVPSCEFVQGALVVDTLLFCLLDHGKLFAVVVVSKLFVIGLLEPGPDPFEINFSCND